MVDVHQGSWFGLPDLGITEAVGGLLGSPRTTQGGSNLLGGQRAAESTAPSVLGVTTDNQIPQVNASSNAPSTSFGTLPNVNKPQGSITTNSVVPTTPQAPQGPSGSEIDSLYNPSIDYLNQAQNTVQGDFTNALDAAQKQYESAISELQGNKQANLNTINQNEVKAGQVKEDALSAARRLYSELRQGYQQRFGGATSAGQAASEIASVEQQRQQGQTGRQYADAVQQINNQRQQLETDFQTGILKLNQAKQQAVSQAQSDFQNKLLQISQNRSQLEGAKAQARLDALQQLRNQVFAIQQQTQQFQQTLELQRQQNTQNLSAYAQQFAQAGQGSTNAVANSGINTNPTSGLTTGANTQPASATLTGQIGTKKDQYGNPIYN